LIAVLGKTDPGSQPRHKGISVLLVEKGDGVSVSKDLGKLGYKGVESCEIVSPIAGCQPMRCSAGLKGTASLR
jgi:alkylation response protein AidB-like acyl-CoA dehydrogenase